MGSHLRDIFLYESLGVAFFEALLIITFNKFWFKTIPDESKREISLD